MTESLNATDQSLCVAVHLLDSALGRPIRSWQFESKELISIGRGDDQDVQIADPYVSRSHANLRYENGKWSLVSLGRSGVLIEGATITETLIQSETTFRLGPDGPTLRFQPAAPRSDNRMTMMFDSTKIENKFELDQAKLQHDVNQIAEGDYFQELQKRAQQLRNKRK